MPQEQENFHQAVATILQVVMFENWLRFYFIKEEENSTASQADAEADLRIELPEKSLEKIREIHPDLLPLAEMLNGRTVDFETSRRAILMYVLNNVENKKLPRGMAESIFSSATFQMEQQLFYTWEQIHEAQLEQQFMDFSTWLELFSKWKDTPGARALASKLLTGQYPQEDSASQN